MWDFYKEIFATVQLATVTIGWTIYQVTLERLGPVAIFLVTMQAGAVFGSMWIGQLGKKKVHAHVADAFINNQLEGRTPRAI